MAGQAAEINLTIKEGETYKQTFRAAYKNSSAAIDLTGYKGKMQVRGKIGDDATIFDLTTENGGIIIEAPATSGKYTLSIPATQTAGKCPAHSTVTGVYDLFFIAPDNSVKQQQYGKVTINPAATR